MTGNIDSNDPSCMVEPARSAVLAWLAEGGGRFTAGSVCRSTAKQARLRVTNGCPDVYTSPASSCRIPTAIPGTSKHESGQAIDIAGDKAYANSIAARYGLGRTVPGEDWHFEVVDPAVARTFGNGSTPTTSTPTSTSTTGTASTSSGSTLDSFTALVGALVDPGTWRRVGLIVAGVLLALIGAYVVADGALPPSVSALLPV